MQKMLSFVRRAVDHYHMIEEGDRIAVGVSGGKDSLTLLAALAELRRFYHAFGLITSKAAKQEESVYEPYYDFSQPVRQVADHRVLAMDRGEREGFL